jgi:membrane protein DedA with SNARE-associated domain
LSAFALYGLPVLFTMVMLGSAGLPIPGFILVIAAGALVEQGQMNLWAVLGLTFAAAVVGDSLGYLIGLRGGRPLAYRLAGKFGRENTLRRAEGWAMHWGGLGIFLSRWLITTLGAALNLISGMTAYPFRRFLLFDIPGQIIWTIETVLIGVLLSDRLAYVLDLQGQVPWIVIGLIGVIIFGRALFGYLRRPRP